MKKALLMLIVLATVGLVTSCEDEPIRPDTPVSDNDTIVVPPLVSLNETSWECIMDVDYPDGTIAHSEIALDFLSDSTAHYGEWYSFSRGNNTSPNYFLEYSIVYSFDGADGGSMTLTAEAVGNSWEVEFTYDNVTETLTMIEPGDYSPEEHARLDKVFHPKD